MWYVSVAAAVHVSLLDASTLGITWATSTPVAPTLEVDGKPIQVATQPYTASGLTRYVHRGATKVQSGQSVQYTVGPPQRSFTAKVPDNTKNVTNIMAFGDMGYIGFKHGGAQFNDKWLAAHLPEIDAVLHVGDLAYDRGNETIWDIFFENIEPFAAARPYMTCVGNEDHADDFAAYRHRLWMPGSSGSANAMYWSLDIGLMHIVSISTEVGAEPYAPGSAQYSWLEKDLAAASASRDRAPWIVVMGHRPMYCSSSDYYDCNMWGPKARTVFEPMFDKYGVDLYLSGHVHMYERTWPVRNGTKVDAGVVHAMIGMGGAGLTPHLTDRPPAWSAARFNEFGVAALQATREQLELRLVEAQTSKVLDAVTLRRPVAMLV